MTLWVFGDSFAYLHSHGNTWPKQVADKLNHELKCYAEGGTSLEYTYEQFNLIKNQINHNDIVILALTELNRRWFSREHITENIWMIIEKNENPKLKSALENYFQYLDNPIVYEAYLTNFMYHVEYVTKQKNLKTVVIPCFESSCDIINKINTKLIISAGNLTKVSLNEFMTSFTNRYTITGISDLRANHLIYSNHCILADKIVSAIETNTNINLNEGFHKHLLNSTNLRDPSFSEKELFSIHLIPEQWNLHQGL